MPNSTIQQQQRTIKRSKPPKLIFVLRSTTNSQFLYWRTFNLEFAQLCHVDWQPLVTFPSPDSKTRIEVNVPITCSFVIISISLVCFLLRLLVPPRIYRHSKSWGAATTQISGWRRGYVWELPRAFVLLCTRRWMVGATRNLNCCTLCCGAAAHEFAAYKSM